MSYVEFLGRWYNVVFVVLGVLGLLAAAGLRVRGRSWVPLGAGLLAAGVTGLTWNGAIHDLGLGSPGPRFPLVLAVSAAVGVLGGLVAARLRDRFFRPITDVRFNRPNHEGVVARIVSRDVGPEPGSGRAQWQDADGALHIVHVHTQGPEIRFGRRVRLGSFDAEVQSYVVVPLPRRGARSPHIPPTDAPL